MPAKTNNLQELWLSAVESEATHGEDNSQPVLTATFPNGKTAEWCRYELYKLRKKTRTLSKKGLEPTDPNYDTSPFDKFKIIRKDNQLLFFREEFFPTDFVIEDRSAAAASVVDALDAITPKRYRHRKPPT